jgi:hypothetical protein
VVVDRLACQASDELVREPYTLAWSEWVTIGVAVVFVESLRIVRKAPVDLDWTNVPRNNCTDAIPPH